jgi:hypothetical protein
VVADSLKISGRFNVLFPCFSFYILTAQAFFKNVKTPFVILLLRFHAINDVVKSGFAEPDKSG